MATKQVASCQGKRVMRITVFMEVQFECFLSNQNIDGVANIGYTHQ